MAQVGRFRAKLNLLPWHLSLKVRKKNAVDDCSVVLIHLQLLDKLSWKEVMMTKEHANCRAVDQRKVVLLVEF